MGVVMTASIMCKSSARMPKITFLKLLKYDFRARKKVQNSRPGQIDFPSGQVAFHSHLPNGQGIRQVVC